MYILPRPVRATTASPLEFSQPLGKQIGEDLQVTVFIKITEAAQEGRGHCTGKIWFAIVIKAKMGGTRRKHDVSFSGDLGKGLVLKERERQPVRLK